MSLRARIFIDFWNFQISWNQRAGDARIDWTLVPRTLISAAEAQFRLVGFEESLVLEETLVYASYNPQKRNDRKLKGWLDSFLDRQPGFRVNIRERKVKSRIVHCEQCGHDNRECSKCGSAYVWSPEKGVDTAIVTDLLSLASEDSYDVAILLSSDADHIPAVEWVQEHGRKVINATWDNHGYDLARTSWASVPLDALIGDLTRQCP